MIALHAGRVAQKKLVREAPSWLMLEVLTLPDDVEQARRIVSSVFAVRKGRVALLPFVLRPSVVHKRLGVWPGTASELPACPGEADTPVQVEVPSSPATR